MSSFKLLKRFTKRIGLNISSEKPKLLEFTFQGDTYYLNNDSSAIYHRDNSIEKLHKMVELIMPSAETVFDVGANCGLFSAFALKKIPQCEIHAFEPSKELIEVVELNCNNNKRININNIALSDRSGEETFYINLDSQQTNSLNFNAVQIFANPDRIIKEKIETNSLDAYCEEKNIPSIDVLKLDVQGLEQRILNGAEKIISTVNQLFIEAVWLEPGTINATLQLRNQFKYAYVVNNVFTGADILLMREPLSDSQSNNVICSISM